MSSLISWPSTPKTDAPGLSEQKTPRRKDIRPEEERLINWVADGMI
jgi:hypothetical protein